LCLPNSPHNLISGQRLRKHNVHLRTDDGNPRLICNGKFVLSVTEEEGMPMIIDQLDKSALSIDVMNWHLKYGHLRFHAFQHISEAPAILQRVTTPCASCSQGNLLKANSISYGIRTNRPLQLLHSNLCGPISPIAYNGHKYICTIIDD
jgi:hypothetical protein